jgi:hypothetical protein
VRACVRGTRQDTSIIIGFGKVVLGRFGAHVVVSSLSFWVSFIRARPIDRSIDLFVSRKKKQLLARSRKTCGVATLTPTIAVSTRPRAAINFSPLSSGVV